jgi:hypothetical protein
MRFGFRRGVTLALGWVPVVALALGLTLSMTAGPVRADDFHTIPRLVQAVDLNTGGPYNAPPIPYGHYAGKNYAGRISGRVHGLLGGGGLFHRGGAGACGSCGGAGCAACGGGQGHGGLFHGGLLGKHKGMGLGSGCGLCGGAGCSSCIGLASTVMASGQGVPAPQGPIVASPQCSEPGCATPGCKKHCGLFGKNKGCGEYDPCAGCGGKGCGLCGGKGKGKGLCRGCGGMGCGLCRGLLSRALGHNKIEWFVGPGGPVPLTPGYVPYVVTTRSPRDFFAFPPFTTP